MYSRSVLPLKLAYRGVLIERPCANCDTVNVHFEGMCDAFRGDTNTYYPNDFEQSVPALFDAMVDTARMVGMPEYFTADLFRDYQWITNHPGEGFVWSVRDTGSDIRIDPYMLDVAERAQSGRSIHFIVRPGSQVPERVSFGAARTWLYQRGLVSADAR